MREGRKTRREEEIEGDRRGEEGWRGENGNKEGKVRRKIR